MVLGPHDRKTAETRYRAIANNRNT
jgi:hypothetical protein